MSTAPGALPAIPHYHRSLFVNREKEIEFVTKKAQSLSLGKPVRQRTIVFWGYKGTGRTWLLRRLEEALLELDGVRAQYLDLGEWADYAPDQAVDVIKEITGRIADQAREWLRGPVAKPNEEQATPDNWGGELPPDVQELLGRYVLVLLLDHVYESDWDLLELLEEHILALLAVQPHVLIVMAGRGRAYPWKTPELRLYTEERHLQPFDEPLTEEQLKRQAPPAVPRTRVIHKMSQGYPLGNYLLAAHRTVAEGMQQTVDSLLDGVPAEERSWLEALCVLRAFDEDHIPIVLAAYFDDSAVREWPYKRVRETRDRLLRTRMVRWEEESGGWVVDKAIRPVLEMYLEQSKPETWKRVHSAAYWLYWSWQQQYLEEMWGLQALFLEEIKRLQTMTAYHAQRLSAIGANGSSAPNESWECIQIFLSYAWEDEQRVMDLYQELHNAGFRPWMAKMDILPGETWETSIRQAIKGSDFFLVCLSANSIDKRGFLQKEIDEALDIQREMLDSDIYLIPVRLEDCQVPTKLLHIQWVDLFEKDGWIRLTKAISKGWQLRHE